MRTRTRYNKHNFDSVFDGDVCRFCHATIFTGTGKAGHAEAHLRRNFYVKRKVGSGTNTDPFRYEVISPAHSNPVELTAALTAVVI